ncbi:MAG: CBM9 family sugar-binding protein, partial [Sedimentisphaerales bacterium]|nr:CBM9 family sugar-binding protein [Sedimentisphaerales bacterium]
MLKKLFYLACLAILLSMVSYTNAQDQHFEADVPKTGAAPVIDGKMDPIWALVGENQIAYDVTAADNKADCSGSWRAYWDDQYFYVFVDVNDEALSGDAADIGTKYQDDSVEIFFDIGNTKDTTYGDNHFQYRFGYDPANAAKGTIGADHTGNPTTNIVAAWAFTSTGYTVEARVPWANLSATPAIDQIMGFEAQINDDDGGGNRNSQLSWNATANEAYQNPSYFGTVTLIAPLKPINIATSPYPLDESDDVEKNVNLNWKPGSYLIENGGTHNLFFGTDFNDVNDATVSNPLGTTVSPAQA